MMEFYVMTLFPELIEAGLSYSVLGRGRKEGRFSAQAINIRDFAHNKHNRVDDAPYGGGAGMVIQAQPVYDCFHSIPAASRQRARVIYLTPQGTPFNQRLAEELAREKTLILLCGHYEGVDERVLAEIVTDPISLGDFVLTGGEVPALAIVDAVARLLPGVLGKEESCWEDSFSTGLLEYPQYTRPETVLGRRVPEVLLSGHHKNIDDWRRQESLRRTLAWRPDLLESAQLSDKDRKFIQDLKNSK